MSLTPWAIELCQEVYVIVSTCSATFMTKTVVEVFLLLRVSLVTWYFVTDLPMKKFRSKPDSRTAQPMQTSLEAN